MYTKEDIEKAKQYLNNEGYGTGSNFTLNMVANLMADYAAKNCVIPAVSGSSSPDDFWKQEYDEAVKEIGKLQDQLKDAESAIRDMESELRSRY